MKCAVKLGYDENFCERDIEPLRLKIDTLFFMLDYRSPQEQRRVTGDDTNLLFLPAFSFLRIHAVVSCSFFLIHPGIYREVT